MKFSLRFKIVKFSEISYAASTVAVIFQLEGHSIQYHIKIINNEKF